MLVERFNSDLGETHKVGTKVWDSPLLYFSIKQFLAFLRLIVANQEALLY
jgi:hypothetical protein